MSDLLPLGIHYNVSRAVYDADPGLNQSLLKDFIKAPSALAFDAKRNPEKYGGTKPEIDPAHFRVGNAIDCLLSEPKTYPERFIVSPETYQMQMMKCPSCGGVTDSQKCAKCKTERTPIQVDKPWNYAATHCIEWREAQTKAGKCVLSIPEAKQVSGMIEGIYRHPDISPILENAKRQVCLIANHPVFGYRMKGLLDLLVDSQPEWIFDNKSSGVGADPVQFHDQCAKLRYHLQAAFYMQLARLCGLEQVKKFGFIVVESQIPHDAVIHYFEEGDPEIELAREKYTEAMPKLVALLEGNRYPGYSNDWIKIKFKPWQIAENRAEYERLS